MTKETQPNPILERSLNYASSNTTVFSDGSTFDYDNGYQSNGAPARTRDSEPTKIVKTGGLLNYGDKEWLGKSIFSAALTVVLAVSVFFLVMLVFSVSQSAANRDAVVEGINSSGASVVNNEIQQEGGKRVVLVETQGKIVKCDVNTISATADTEPTAHIFCVPGQPATISIPVPHDPNNPFYSAPKADSDR